MSSITGAVAHDDGVRGLKIRTSKGDLLWDSSWTAGVEYEDDADDRDYESDESDEDSYSESEASFEEEIRAKTSVKVTRRGNHKFTQSERQTSVRE